MTWQDELLQAYKAEAKALLLSLEKAHATCDEYSARLVDVESELEKTASTANTLLQIAELVVPLELAPEDELVTAIELLVANYKAMRTRDGM